MTDITVAVIFHNEGMLAVPALNSMKNMVAHTRKSGLKVEAFALIDRADEFTKKIVNNLGGEWLDEIISVDFGDLGLTRNKGVELAKGDFISFLDGDDLWDKEWLCLAHQRAFSDVGVIYHPEVLYYFDESDRKNHSMTKNPSAQAKSFYMWHMSSVESFDREVLLFNNVWTANIFAHKNIYKKFRYRALNRGSGFGVEDWSWNLETTFGGMLHDIVPGTIHFIRVKEHGSLGRSNVAEGVLPYIPQV